MPLLISARCAPMSHPGSACASTAALEVVVPSPGLGHRAGDYAQRGTTVGIEATQAVRAQTASPQKKQPLAQPTTMATSISSILCFRREGTTTKNTPQTRPSCKDVRRDEGVRAATVHIKETRGRFRTGPGWFIHGTWFITKEKRLNTPIRAGPRTPDPPPTPPRSTP